MQSRIVVFIANHLQYAVAKERAVAVEEYAVATDDPDVRYLCERDGVMCYDLWHYLSDADASEAKRVTYRCLEGVGKLFGGVCIEDGCDIIDTVKYDLTSVFTKILAGTKAVTNLLQEICPEAVIHFAEMERTEVWMLSTQEPDLFNAVVARVSARLGYPTRELCNSESRQLTEYISRKKRFEKLTVKPSCECVFPSAITAIAISDELMREQEVLWDALSVRKRWDWVVIAGKSVSQAVTLNSCPFLSLKWIDGLPFSRFNGRRVLERIRDIRKGGVTEEWALLLDEVFDFVWATFGEWVECAHLSYCRARWMALSYAPHLAVTNWDGIGRIRCMISAFRESGSQSLSVTHSGPTCFRDQDEQMDPRYWNTRGHATAVGSIEVRRLANQRIDGFQLFPIGPLRFELADLLEKEREMADPSCYQPDNIHIQFITSGARSMYDFVEDNAVYYETLSQIRSLIESHSKWWFELRKHPVFDFLFIYERMGLGELPNLRRLTDDEPRNMEGISIALMYNNFSTVGVDAIAAGVPVICLRNGIRRGNHCVMEDWHGSLVVHSVDELTDELERLVEDEAYRKCVVKTQKVFLRGFLCADANTAASNMVKLCDDLVQRNEKKMQPVVNPAARWVSDLIMLIGYIQHGAEEVVYTGRGGKHESVSIILNDLRIRGRSLQFNTLDECIRTESLGEYLLNMVVYGADVGMVCSRIKLLFAIQRIMPASIRPAWHELRIWLIRAFWIDIDKYRGTWCRLLKI